MIAAVRIRGLVGTKIKQEARMGSLMLRKKYNCILLDEKDLPRIEKVKEMISFGEIDDETLRMLVSKRGKKGNKSLANADEVIKGLKSGKSLRELGVTPYFRLSPPRGGFKKSMKLHYPKGVLAHNKEINSLLKRMI